MNLELVPKSALAKLLSLEANIATTAERLTVIDASIDGGRARLRGDGRRPDESATSIQGELARLLAEQKTTQQRLQAEKSVASACRAWLDNLPAGAKLEPVTIKPNGLDLAGARKRISAVDAELAALKNAPTPSADIRARVQGYLQSLAPIVRGVGASERLSISWPGNTQAMLATLFPDQTLALVMGEIERMSCDPLPVAKRPARVAELERELDDLHRVEEALIAAAIADGQPAHRSPQAPPQAVLGVAWRQ
jgi:hypothetical protein